MSNPIGSWLGLETQPRYKAAGDLSVAARIKKMHSFNIRLVRLSHKHLPEGGLTVAKQQIKKSKSTCAKGKKSRTKHIWLIVILG